MDPGTGRAPSGQKKKKNREISVLSFWLSQCVGGRVAPQRRALPERRESRPLARWAPRVTAALFSAAAAARAVPCLGVPSSAHPVAGELAPSLFCGSKESLIYQQAEFWLFVCLFFPLCVGSSLSIASCGFVYPSVITKATETHTPKGRQNLNSAWRGLSGKLGGLPSGGDTCKSFTRLKWTNSGPESPDTWPFSPCPFHLPRRIF